MYDERQSIPMRELETLLLEKVRRRFGCGDIRQVTVIPREREGDWICGCVQAGNLDPQVWRPALTKLETEYREMYRLAPRSGTPEYKVVKIGPNAYWRG
jgi:hypothetical protein